MLTDARRWDIIHQKTQKDVEGHSVYAEEKEKEFPRGCLICDLGGGTGADALYFLKQGHKVVLFDISSFALSNAASRAKDSGFEKELVTKQVDFGLEKVPLNPESIDVAYSRIALHYFPKKETQSIFSSVYSALKPGGVAFFTFKSPDDTAEMTYLKETAVQYEPGVYIENGQLRARFTVEELQKMLMEVGIFKHDVHPYKELLGTDTTGVPQVLLLNEIIFRK